MLCLRIHPTLNQRFRRGILRRRDKGTIMYYSLNKKSERKRFWLECAKSLEKVSELNQHIFSWKDVGKKLDATKTLKFWEACTIYWNRYNITPPKNVQDTLMHYEEYGDELEGYYLF